MVGSTEADNKGLGEGVECQLFSPASETSIKEVPTNNHRKGIVAFLLIAFGMAWAFWEISIRLGGSHKNPLLAVLAFVGAFFQPLQLSSSENGLLMKDSLMPS